jgi:hypothetical protein
MDITLLAELVNVLLVVGVSVIATWSIYQLVRFN